LIVSDKYGCLKLKDQVEKIMISSELTNENVSGLIVISDRHNANKLKQVCCEYIRRHYSQMIETIIISWDSIRSGEHSQSTTTKLMRRIVSLVLMSLFDNRLIIDTLSPVFNKLVSLSSSLHYTQRCCWNLKNTFINKQHYSHSTVHFMSRSNNISVKGLTKNYCRERK
jgi:hypothetical protein